MSSESRSRGRTVRAVGLLSAVLVLVLALAGLGTDADRASGQTVADSRPNVVVIMTDDQDVASLSAMPKVRRHLGRAGTRFSTSFATTPLCCPSRASFLTGQYAHNHGVRGNRKGFQTASYQEFDDRGVLPVALQADGYRTGYVGKYLNGYGERNPHEVPDGWNRWAAAVHPTATDQFDYTLNRDGRLQRYGSEGRHYQTDVYAGLAQRFIAESAERPDPFFLVVSTGAPHLESGVKGERRNPRPAPRHRRAFLREPLPRPRSFNERRVGDKPRFIRNRRRLDRGEVRQLQGQYRDRLASLQAVDDAVADVVARLRQTGELDNTVIAYTSDNGYLLGEHRLRGKVLLYEESARVPLLIRGPGFPAGATRDQVTGNIDLAPTIFELTGATPMRRMDGRSLLPLAASSSAGRDRDILLENALSSGVRDRRYAYIEHPRGERELYDLRRDPLQLRSRHDDRRLRGVRREMTARLRQLEDCAGAGCR